MLAGAEIELVAAGGRETRLREALTGLLPRYDVVLIDCPPSLGLLTVNALTAARSVVVPIQCEFLALEGLGQLMTTVDRVKRGLNPSLDVAGVLMTMFDARTRLSAHVVDEVRRYFPHRMFATVGPALRASGRGAFLRSGHRRIRPELARRGSVRSVRQRAHDPSPFTAPASPWQGIHGGKHPMTVTEPRQFTVSGYRHRGTVGRHVASVRRALRHGEIRRTRSDLRRRVARARRSPRSCRATCDTATRLTQVDLPRHPDHLRGHGHRHRGRMAIALAREGGSASSTAICRSRSRSARSTRSSAPSRA